MTKREEEVVTTSATLQTVKYIKITKKSSINKVRRRISKVGEESPRIFEFNEVINIDSKYNVYGNDDASVFFLS